MSGIHFDFSGAHDKTQTLKMTPRALRFQATRWASGTVRDLKRSAANMRKGHAMGHGKTGDLAGATSMRIASKGGKFMVSVGTGMNTKDIKYAKIQDEGGTVTAINKMFKIMNLAGRPRVGPFLTIPLRGVKGSAANYPGIFGFMAKSGELYLGRPKAFASGKRKGERKTGEQAGLEALFLLKSSVKIPASLWFTSVINAREVELQEMMAPDVVYNIASQMSGGRG